MNCLPMGTEPAARAGQWPPDLVPRSWLAEEIEAALADSAG